MGAALYFWGMTELDEATRARIRAEEAERLKVRAELDAERRVRERPSYPTGALLNLLLSGGGLLYLGQVGPGLAWLLGSVALGLIVSPWVGWPVGLIGSFIHYNATYDRLYESRSDAEEEARRQSQITARLAFVLTVLLTIVGLKLLGLF